MKRRDFIQKASLASAGVMAASPLLSHPFDDGVIKTFGFQAYTVRDVIYQDMAGTLAKGGRDAIAVTKKWLNELDGSIDPEMLDRGAALSAEVIAGDEAQLRLQPLYGKRQ